MQNVVFNAFPRGLKLTRPTKHSGDAWLTFSDSNKPYVPVAWRPRKSRRSEIRLFREFLAKSVFRAKYQRCIFATFFSHLCSIFFFVLPFTSISRRYIDIVKERTIRSFWFQIIDILLSGGSELLVTTVPSNAVSRLADGICSFGRLIGGYQKPGHLSILRWLLDPNLQSLHRFRGKRANDEWNLAATCINRTFDTSRVITRLEISPLPQS